MGISGCLSGVLNVPIELDGVTAAAVLADAARLFSAEVMSESVILATLGTESPDGPLIPTVWLCPPPRMAFARKKQASEGKTRGWVYLVYLVTYPATCKRRLIVLARGWICYRLTNKHKYQTFVNKITRKTLLPI